MASISEIKRARTDSGPGPLQRAPSLIEDARFSIVTWLSDEELPRLAHLSRQWCTLTQEATQNLYRDFLIRVGRAQTIEPDRKVYWDIQAESLDAIVKTNALVNAFLEQRLKLSQGLNSSQKTLVMRREFRTLSKDEFAGEWNVDVQNQGLCFLPREILYWTGLRNLNVSESPLSEIPEELLDRRWLETIHLQGTHFTAQSIASLLRKRVERGYPITIHCTKGLENEQPLQKLAEQLQGKALELNIQVEQDFTALQLQDPQAVLSLSLSQSGWSNHGLEAAPPLNTSAMLSEQSRPLL